MTKNKQTETVNTHALGDVFKFKLGKLEKKVVVVELLTVEGIETLHVKNLDYPFDSFLVAADSDTLTKE